MDFIDVKKASIVRTKHSKNDASGGTKVGPDEGLKTP